eukprot:11677007-Ditylum_brightwellii.AAC.1
MYKEEISKTSIKDEKKLLLKGLISGSTVNSSSNKADIDNQQIKFANNTTAIAQGTISQSPLSLENENGISQDRREQSKVPSNNMASKHSKIIKGIEQRRSISKATVHIWLVTLGYI